MHPLRKLVINLAMITQFPAFIVFLLLKFKQFLSKFLGSLLLAFFFAWFLLYLSRATMALQGRIQEEGVVSTRVQGKRPRAKGMGVGEGNV